MKEGGIMRKCLGRLLGIVVVVCVVTGCFIAPPVMAAQKVKIEWLQWWRTEMGEQNFDTFVTMFNKSHADIEVEAISVPISQMMQQITSNFAVGKLADVIGMNMPWNTDFVRMGIMEPLDAYLSADKTLDAKQLVQAPMGKYQGHVWMLPATNHCLIFYYNKDYFKEAGITEPPKTWDEFKQAAIKLTKPEKNQYGYTLYLSLQGNGGALRNEVLPLLYTAGGRSVRDEKPNLNSPEVIETLQFLKELNEAGVVVPGALSRPEQQKIEEFASGRAAMYIGTMPHINVIRNRNPKLNFGVAAVPMKRKLATRNHGWEIVMSSQSKNKQAAWTFINWLVSKDISALFAEKAGQLPANLASKADYIAKDPLISEVDKISRTSELVEETRIIPNGVDADRAAVEEFQKMFTGQQSPAKAAEAAQKRWEEIFSRK
jgi:multiple sugar transport system substrate-binding protein